MGFSLPVPFDVILGRRTEPGQNFLEPKGPGPAKELRPRGVPRLAQHATSIRSGQNIEELELLEPDVDQALLRAEGAR